MTEIPPCSITQKQRLKFYSPSLVMMASPYELNIFKQDAKLNNTQTNLRGLVWARAVYTCHTAAVERLAGSPGSYSGWSPPRAGGLRCGTPPGGDSWPLTPPVYSGTRYNLQGKIQCQSIGLYKQIIVFLACIMKKECWSKLKNGNSSGKEVIKI